MTPRRRRPAPAARPAPWRPDLPAVGAFDRRFPLVPGFAYFLRFEWDARARVTEWAVALLRVDGDQARRIAVFDSCHDKGVHVHYYDRSENEFRQELLWDVASHDDLARCLDDVIDLVCGQWERFERRSSRGR